VRALPSHSHSQPLLSPLAPRPLPRRAASFKSAKNSGFDVEFFLETLGVAKTPKTFRRNQIIFAQGDSARDVLFIRKGRVKRTVVSPSGKEAVVGILGPGDFFGEWCLSEQPIYIATATAMEPATIWMIPKEQMLRALHAEHGLSDAFIAYLLCRTMRVEEKLIDQLFNSTEKRLARALVRLARYGRQLDNETRMPKVSQQTLAAMIGTTRPHVNYFMNKFRRLGFIDYGGRNRDLRIRPSLMNVILPE
jgi:CRP/FNR family transcriptional regulator, cyclic AMP receptor protein